MSVYVSTAAPRAPRELWALLDELEGAGVHDVELGFCRLELGGTDLVARLRGRSFDFLVHNYFPPTGDLVLNMASADREIAVASERFIVDALELCAQLAAPVYSMHAGFVTDPMDFTGTSYILPPPGAQAEVDAAAERYAAAVDRVLSRAEELGVRLLVENSVCTEDLAGKLLLLTADELAEFFARFAGRPLGLLLDTGHLNVTATTMGFERLAFVDALERHVGAFHLHDNDGVVDQHLPVEPGTWAHELVSRRVFDGLPVVVEARFPGVLDAAGYAARLARDLAADGVV